jgi:tRNA (mo5U34)-methyltransferase
MVDSPAAFLSQGEAFRERLDQIKRSTVVPDYGWYPYGSLSSLPILANLLGDDLAEILGLLASEPMADVGCGDGDLAMLFAGLGFDVDAVDHAESNYNQMRGVNVLRRALGYGAGIHDIDLDGRFHLPREQYGLVAFLGTLYHLKNPFYVLEELAKRTAYCLLSTRIAQRTYRTGAVITAEPTAYLLDAREANNDPTNY